MHSSHNSGVYSQMQFYISFFFLQLRKRTQNLKGIWLDLRSQNHPKEKEMQEGKWVFEEAL